MLHDNIKYKIGPIRLLSMMQNVIIFFKGCAYIVFLLQAQPYAVSGLLYCDEKPFTIKCMSISYKLTSEYNQTNQTYSLVICVYILLCVIMMHKLNQNDLMEQHCRAF